MVWTPSDLVIQGMSMRTSAEAIRTMCELLYEKGYVRESFTEAVLEREQAFPTGLPTPGIQVAIPHADVEHVVKEGIAIGVLDEPVEFVEMGTDDRTVEVSIIFMLAIKESDTLVPLLRNLVGILQDAEFLKELTSEREPTRIAEMFNEQLPQLKEA